MTDSPTDTSLDLARLVREGLTKAPKQLPPSLFYDAEGSRLFEQITELPEYYLTRCDSEILARHGAEIVALAGASTVVELGAGSATKTRLLLEPLLARAGEARYVPVDVSASALEHAAVALRERYPTLLVDPVLGAYPPSLAALGKLHGRKLVLFLGSSIGNYDADEGAALLAGVRAHLAPGDAFLLGTDDRKDASLLVPAYDDARGVTAAFNLNLLARINRELGGEFDLAKFRHVALWNDRDSRMEMHLESRAQQDVRIAALGRAFHFEAGERIHTENSYKYTDAMVEDVLHRGGFRRLRTFRDEKGFFSNHLAVAV